MFTSLVSTSSIYQQSQQLFVPRETLTLLYPPKKVTQVGGHL